MLQLAPLILRNVLRNRRRTLLTLASTAVSLAILTLMIAIYQGFFYGPDVSDAGAHRLVTRDRVALVQPLPAAYEQKIKQIDGIEYVMAYNWFQGKFKDDKQQYQFARAAVDADHLFDIYSDFKVPPDQLEAFKKNRTACALSQNIADQMHFKLGDRITIVGDIYPVTVELVVAAIFTNPKSTDALFFHREYLTESLSQNDDQRDMVGVYMMRVKNIDDMPRIANAIDARFDSYPYPTHTESEKEFSRSFLAFLGNLKLYLGMVCAAVTFTILLVSANAISMSVRERTRETAIMRTLGYAPGEILQLIIGESILISIFGCLLGISLAALLLFLANMSPTFGLPNVEWQGALIVLGAAIVVGVLAAAVPAIVTSRKNVVESLRFTG